jgi:type IV pilus assembly protein PilC
MPEYLYVAADKSGKKIEGKMVATNEGELRMVLRGQGLRPVKIKRPSVAELDLNAFIGEFLGTADRVPPETIMNFIKQLHVMINSGVPLVQALELFLDQESNLMMKKILLNTQEKVKSGTFLWEAFSVYPNIFEKVFISLIRAGEGSGTLDTMLMRCGKYMENNYRMKKMIKSSMMYPVIVLVVSLGVILLMLGLVIPKFEEMITSSGGELPLPTRMVLDLSHFVTSNALAIAAFLSISGYLVHLYAKSAEGRVVLQRLMLSVPMFGDLIQKSGVARFARTMSTLISSGVPMVDSLEISKNASDHVAFEDAIGQMKKEIELGSTVSTAMFKQKLFPKMATQMISVGENTGSIDKMLERVADFYEEEVSNTIQGMMKLIEPLMLVVLGAIVGGLLIAMYLPIFQMAGSQTQ